MRRLAPALLLCALLVSACGSQGVALEPDEELYEGAQLFSERCAGCHSLKAAGARGSGENAQRVQGPDFDKRKVSEEDALFAIRNGGFSGAIMPQNIVTGREAAEVARFLASRSGGEAERAAQPGEGTDQLGEETGEDFPPPRTGTEPSP